MQLQSHYFQRAFVRNRGRPSPRFLAKTIVWPLAGPRVFLTFTKFSYMNIHIYIKHIYFISSTQQMETFCYFHPFIDSTVVPWFSPVFWCILDKKVHLGQVLASFSDGSSPYASALRPPDKFSVTWGKNFWDLSLSASQILFDMPSLPLPKVADLAVINFFFC